MPKVRQPVTKGKDLRAQASWFSWLTFSWALDLDETARKRRLNSRDFGGLKEEETIEYLSEKLEKTYEE